MKNMILLCCGFLGFPLCHAFSDQIYMDRFNTYLSLSQDVSGTPTDTFLAFIKGNAPLSTKLREKWLYELAKGKNWSKFSQYYQDSKDLNLECYNMIAKYNLGMREEALKASIPLWLTGNSRSASCDSLFNLLLRDAHFDQNLITKRFSLALDRHHVDLARYLLRQYKIPHETEIRALSEISQNPVNLRKLSRSELNSIIYLYGLKNMVSINMGQALKLWQENKTQNMLNEQQQQAFLAHVVLYKAMRNHDDTLQWFAKIKSQYYNDTLLDWRIRFALKRQNWPEVTTLINNSKYKEAPCWQYWLARSLEEQGRIAEAQAIYELLANNRHYYGFLASLRLKKKPNFINEVPNTNLDILNAYQPLINQIYRLYLTKQNLQASRLLNDFISELPKEKASVLVYWIDNKLQWYGKSVVLSNNERLHNQLFLRFPLAYQESISFYSKKYTIEPELIYSIIRQESGFREDAMSSAGARGLMQVMPYTAQAVSKTDKIPYHDQRQLFLPSKNINIGVAYLKQLSKRFDHHPILIAAAYNAGPKQVMYWLKMHPPKEIDLWIETLPWQETRNYLKNIMAFYVVYQYRLDRKVDLSHFLASLA